MDEIEENIQSDTEFNTLLNNIVKDKGGSPELYKNLLNQIAYHESAGTMDPTIKQRGGGPGRGKYQFEGKEGGSNRILSSAVRTKNYYKHIGSEVPKFVQAIINKGTEDASTLSSEEQDILALADLRMKKGLDLGQFASGKISAQDIWADHWWAGDKSKRDGKIKSFNNSISKLNNQMVHDKSNQFELIDPRLSERDIPRVQDATSVNQPNLKQMENHQLPNQLPNNQNQPQASLFKQDLGSYLDNYISNISSEEENLNEFNGGGTHEQNPNGGIPQGIGSNGKTNTVEEGETSSDLKNGKYIFSNRIKL